MPALNPMSVGLDETALRILKNRPLGHIEHGALDTILGGLRQYLCIVPGGPGTGKTTFMQQIADGWAIAGHPVVIFEGELGRDSMLAKSLTRISGGELTHDDMNGDGMSEDKRGLFEKVLDIYARSIAERMYIIPGEIKYAGMRKAIEEVADKHGEPPLVITRKSSLCRRNCALPTSVSVSSSSLPSSAESWMRPIVRSSLSHQLTALITTSRPPGFRR